MLEGEGFRSKREHLPDLQRLVVAVDPATKSHENADMTAFTVAGREYPVESLYGDDRPSGYLLHCEQDRYMPTQAMKRAVALYHEHQADCVVIEANNGGDYLPALLEQVDPTVNWRSFTPRASSGLGRPRRRSCTSRPEYTAWGRLGRSQSWKSR
ncbi:hypothetical protein OHS71_08920 [Streptomyces sp. NBC_00377]